MANEAVEQATDKTYYGLTLSQHAERIRKLATERGLTGEVFDGTVVGGLSAISYDSDDQQYYIISDDRSAKPWGCRVAVMLDRA